MGLIDKLYGCFLSVQGPVDEHPKMSAFLQQASALLHSMCKLCYVVTGRWALFEHCLHLVSLLYACTNLKKNEIASHQATGRFLQPVG